MMHKENSLVQYIQYIITNINTITQYLSHNYQHHKQYLSQQ